MISTAYFQPFSGLSNSGLSKRINLSKASPQFGISPCLAPGLPEFQRAKPPTYSFFKRVMIPLFVTMGLVSGGISLFNVYGPKDSGQTVTVSASERAQAETFLHHILTTALEKENNPKIQHILENLKKLPDQDILALKQAISEGAQQELTQVNQSKEEIAGVQAKIDKLLSLPNRDPGTRLELIQIFIDSKQSEINLLKEETRLNALIQGQVSPDSSAKTKNTP